MNNLETITINGEEYLRKSSLPLVETDHVIVIAQRGWIFEGYRVENTDEKLKLINANVVRSWNNGRGIGGLAKDEYKHEYVLDPIGTVEFAPEGVIAVVDVEW